MDGEKAIQLLMSHLRQCGSLMPIEWVEKNGSGELMEAFTMAFDALQKVGQYEDAEEQGRLVVLPCMVGDIVYTIENNEIVEWRISYIGLHPCNIGYANLYNLKNRHLVSVAFSDIGKTVFLTREEAEQALKGGAE